jgi:hypothetical protein
MNIVEIYSTNKTGISRNPVEIIIHMKCITLEEKFTELKYSNSTYSCKLAKIY